MSQGQFISEVGAYIRRHGLLREGAPVIVALSGGADSVALLSVLTRLGYDCRAAHCNFHLRGAESDRDMDHARRIADVLDTDLYIRNFDVAARRRLTGESLEMACRELRYAWFAELLDRDCAQAVAVGHHREDQAETFFLNLLRGSGVAGLAGMRPRQGDVVRPLLERTRPEIEDYLRGEGLEWITDSSNACDDFARNRLRNRLIPVLEELFPGATEAIGRSMAHLREAAALHADAVKSFAAPYILENDEIDLARLADNPHAGLLLYETLRPEGFRRQQTDDMLEAARRGSTATFHAPGGNHTREADHGRLRAGHADVHSAADAVDVSLLHDIAEPVRIAVGRFPVAAFKPENDPAVIYIDARALAGRHRWQLRHWRRGDRMRPFGMTGTKAVSDIMAAARLSAAQKRNLLLLTRDDEIFWAVGLRASAHFAVGPKTKEYIRLQLIQ